MLLFKDPVGQRIKKLNYDSTQAVLLILLNLTFSCAGCISRRLRSDGLTIGRGYFRGNEKREKGGLVYFYNDTCIP